jgi:hypothetical protein
LLPAFSNKFFNILPNQINDISGLSMEHDALIFACILNHNHLVVDFNLIGVLRKLIEFCILSFGVSNSARFIFFLTLGLN